MSACDIVAEVSTVPTITAALGQPAAITGSVAVPSTITGALAARSAISGALASRSTITADVAASPSITAALIQAPTLEASVGDGMQLYLDSLERAAERARRDVIKLATYSTTIAVHTAAPAAVEMPTGLVLYPSFRDSGFLVFKFNAAHQNMSGATVNVALVYDVFGGTPITVANFTSPVFPAGTAAYQFGFSLELYAQGPTSEAYTARMVWSDANGTNAVDFPGRTNSGIFGNPANGDGGDVEVRLEVSVSITGTTFNVRHSSIEQHCPRGISQ